MKIKFKKLIDQIKARKNKIVIKISATATAVFVTGMSAISASAAVDTSGITSKLTELSGGLTTVGWVAALVAVGAAAIAFFCGSHGMQTGKKILIGVAVGCSLLTLGDAFVGFFK